MSVTSALWNRSYRRRGIVKQRSLNCRHLNGLYIIHQKTPTLETEQARLISQQTGAEDGDIFFKSLFKWLRTH